MTEHGQDPREEALAHEREAVRELERADWWMNNEGRQTAQERAAYAGVCTARAQTHALLAVAAELRAIRERGLQTTSYVVEP